MFFAFPLAGGQRRLGGRLTSATTLRARLPSLSQTSKTVQILNPSPSGKRYTSRKNAERLVQRGMAIYVRGRSAIEYVAAQWLTTLGAYEAARRMDDRFIEERGGVLWWNGCDHRPNACHVPGENVLLPRPDRAGGYIQAMQGGKW